MKVNVVLGLTSTASFKAKTTMCIIPKGVCISNDAVDDMHNEHTGCTYDYLRSRDTDSR